MQIGIQLMFENKVADIIALWRRAFPDMDVLPLTETNGKIAHAHVVISGYQITLFDSPAPHGFTLTPSFSMTIQVETAAEVDTLADILGEGGQVLMPRDAYPFSPRFTWIEDPFGVNWQIAQVKASV